MRKLKLQMQVSVNGFVAGPSGELDWATWSWDDGLKQYVTALTEPVDCILLGRVLAEGFIPAWASRAADPASAEPGAHKMNDTPKVIFSRALTTSKWPNATIARGSIVDEVTRLKAAPGGDLIAYGGATFVADLIQHQLIDEYHLFVNPTAIKTGLSIFRGEPKVPLELVNATPFACGIVVLSYAPAR